MTYQQSMYSTAWGWIQVFKERSRSDLLGIGSVIPAYFSEQVRANYECTQLLAKEAELIQHINKSPPDLRWQERIELDNLDLCS